MGDLNIICNQLMPNEMILIRILQVKIPSCDLCRLASVGVLLVNVSMGASPPIPNVMWSTLSWRSGIQVSNFVLGAA